MAGQCITAPKNDLSAPQRNFITGVRNAHDIGLYQMHIDNDF